MKRLLILISFMPLLALAQENIILSEGSSPNLYVTHTVAAKENYYSIGRMYNISPKEIAPFNNLQLEKGLSLGQKIKVPLTAGNFVQGGTGAADEVLVPVYHTVQDKEGLYRISVNHNKLPLETLKQWNHISGESVSNGTKLIVGYLKVKKDLSPLSGMAKPVTLPAEINVKENVKEVEKPVVVKEEKQPAVKTPVKEPVKEKEKIVVAEPVKKDPPKEVKTIEPVVKEKEEVAATTWKTFNGGVFKTDYEKQSQHADLEKETGSAAIFKSTSGWEDGKYYCLHNSATPGTIIKITNNTSGKAAYVKVLDVIPDIKQNTSLLIRISNAAAEELGVSEGKFDCTVNYSK